MSVSGAGDPFLGGRVLDGIIFDRRLIDKRYGDTIMRSLPPAKLLRRPDSIYKFLKKKGAVS